jgi:hypothetical protein
MVRAVLPARRQNFLIANHASIFREIGTACMFFLSLYLGVFSSQVKEDEEG